MPGVVNLTTLTTAVRRRADMENTLFVSDTEIQEYIQGSYGDLFDLMIESAGPEQFVRIAELITTTPGQPIYTIMEDNSPAVPALIYKPLMCVLSDGTTTTRLDPSADFDVYPEVLLTGVTGRPEKYRVLGPELSRAAAGTEMVKELLIQPAPDAAYTVFLAYIPSPPDLTTTSVQNLYGYSGWEEYVVCDAAAKCAEKEESFDLADRLLRRREMVAQRIRWHMKTMHMDGAGRIRDIDKLSDLVGSELWGAR